MVLIIAGWDWIAVSVSASSITAVWNFSRWSQISSTFVVIRWEIRTEFEERERDAVLTMAIYHERGREGGGRVHIRTQIRCRYRDSRGGPSDTIGDGTWCPFVKRASKLCFATTAESIVSFPHRQPVDIAELDCASSDLPDKYYPECQPRPVITCHAVARKWKVPPYFIEAINYVISFAFYVRHKAKNIYLLLYLCWKRSTQVLVKSWIFNIFEC